MKFSQSTLLAILAGVISVEAGCTQDGGNYYCSSTNKVTYQNVGYSGSYKDVTNMDESSGKCTQKSKSFSGNLSPLDEELSVHFRGPLKLLKFGVYYPSDGSNKKRDEPEDCTTTLQHAHHKHKRATVEVTQTVLVDGNGNTVTSTATNEASSAPEEESSESPSTTSAQNNNQAKLADSRETGEQNVSYTSGTETASTSESSSSSSSDGGSVASGDWERVAWYEPGSTDNVTFMNYYGGSGSGVWSGGFGNSISYANKDASGGSSKAVALEETTIKSNVEYMIFSSQSCDDGDGCGYYRDGIPAYHGFGGNQKIFVFEFEMPSANDDATINHDMPAIWLLNAKIPRTLQYGDASCSCWKSGCGELDAWEILSDGSDKLISHLHDGQGNDGTSNGGGGSQDYFDRPTSNSMKGAIVFSGEDISILEVDDDFESSLSSSTVKNWINKSGSTASVGN